MIYMWGALAGSSLSRKGVEQHFSSRARCCIIVYQRTPKSLIIPDILERLAVVN